MLYALEGSQAVAKAVALCRPGVVAAYPITPQTHIVENISKLVADGEMITELISVESEFSAASVALGAAAAGSRSYTASSSQGIMLMAEVLFNIAGLRVPMVMTCANRAVGAPLSIWNDHSDSMAVRDSGWIQLYCNDNQDAVDTLIQAYRISERTELPVMVCMDGFILTHTLEIIDIPDLKKVDKYLGDFKFERVLDPTNPISIGTLVSPDFFTEVRYSHHMAMKKALKEIIDADKAFERLFKRASGGLLSIHGPKDAKIAIVSIGSVTGTLQAAMEYYPQKSKTKLIKLRAFRPFPLQELCDACVGVDDLIVVERAFSPGLGGIVGSEVTVSLNRMTKTPKIWNVAVGLGGRDVPLDIYPRLIKALKDGSLEQFSIFDADLSKLPKEDR